MSRDTIIGRANRFLASRVSRIATGFPDIKELGAALAAKTRYTAIDDPGGDRRPLGSLSRL